MSEYVYATDDREGHWLTGEKIVRCRDCKHSRKDGTFCMFFASWEPIAGGDEYAEIPAVVEPGGFCKWGEPREAPDPTCDECGMRCIEKYEAGCPREER